MAFRRLTYHRSYFIIGMGVALLIALGGYVAEVRLHPADPILILGGACALLLLARGFTGSWSKQQIRVDVPAGKLMLPDGSIHELDAIGALTVESHLLPPPNRHRVHEFRLRAANLGYYPFHSVYESETRKRLVALEAAVLQSRVRKLLERPSADGAAFRSAPDVADAVRTQDTQERVLAALDVLATDPDSHVSEQATAVASALRANGRA